MKISRFIFVGFLIIVLMAGSGCTQSETTSSEKTLIWGTTEINTNLDPANSRSPEIIPMTGIFEGLLRIKIGTYDVIPNLAESWEMIDAETFVFKLREDVKFHDGSRLDAAAVKSSLERLLTLQQGTYWFVSAYLEPSGIEIVDDYTLRMRLTKPYVAFPNVLATFPSWIVSPSSVEKWGEDFEQHATGTGPFKLAEWIPNEKIELVRNEDYWDETRTPKLDRIIIKFFADSGSLKMAIDNGDVDVAYRNVNVADVPDLVNNPEVETIEQAGSLIRFLFLNFEQPYTSETLVRQAIAYAIDYDKLVNLSSGDRACSFFGCASPYNASYFSDTFRYDPEQAKSLLAEAGYPDGIPEKLTLWYNTVRYGPQDTDMAAIIQSNLKDIGIDVEAKSVEWTTYIEYLNEGTVQMGTFGFGAQDPDPSQVAQINYHKDGANAKRINWADDEASALADAAATETDPAKRIEMYLQLQRTYDPLVHKLPIFTIKDYIFYREGVSGIQLSPAPLWFLIDFTQLDKE